MNYTEKAICWMEVVYGPCDDHPVHRRFVDRRQNGQSGLNGMSLSLSHTPPPPFYYQGHLYPPYSSTVLSQFYAQQHGVGGEGTGSEDSSSPSSPRESSDENERGKKDTYF